MLMIDYEKWLELLKLNGQSTYTIQRTAYLSPYILTSAKHNKNVTLNTVNKLCYIANCTPNDILVYERGLNEIK